LDAWLSGNVGFDMLSSFQAYRALYYAIFSGFMHQRHSD
jgi:hypothetical protein